MQFSSKFTIGVHVLTAISYFEKEENVTSNFLAASVGVNPVIVRTVMSELKDAGLIEISQGKTGIRLAKPLSGMTFYDVYKATNDNGNGLFRFHENPNPACPVGRNIHKAMDERLLAVQEGMEREMKAIRVSDVYEDVVKEIKKGEM